MSDGGGDMRFVGVAHLSTCRVHAIVIPSMPLLFTNRNMQRCI
jgi:hypothetical protein